MSRAVQGVLDGKTWRVLTDVFVPANRWIPIVGDATIGSLLVRSDRDGDPPSVVEVILEPSIARSDGAYIVVSERYEVPVQPGSGAEAATNLLEKLWAPSLHHSEVLIARIRAAGDDSAVFGGSE
jgi:hypothetical protein